MPKDSEQIDVETPNGKISAKKIEVEPVPQKILVVTGDELKQLESIGKNGADFVKAFDPDEKDISLRAYDRAFRSWQLSGYREYSKETVINLLGGYLGNKCVNKLNMEWVVVNDEYGTDYAVRSKTSEVMAFPFSTVLKRIEDNEYDFLYSVYHTIKQTLESGEYKLRPSAPPK